MKSLTKPIRSKLAVHDSHVQFSLPVAGVLGDVHSAFFGLRINAGKAVLAAMMETERTALCGPKGVPDAQRTAYRGGNTRSWITLGGRRIALRRPRARARETGELSLPTFGWAADADPLNAATMAAIAAGVSTRRYRRTLDPLPAEVRQSSVSRSAVSRRFIAKSAEQLQTWLSRPIKTVPPVIMIDGIHFRDRVVLLALGFDAQGKKHVLGLREGSTEKGAVVRALLSDLIDEALYRTFRTTNPIENLNGLIAHYTRNVRRWRDGQMVLRWIATALHEAGTGFRAVRGYRDMKRLVSALEKHARSHPDSSLTKVA